MMALIVFFIIMRSCLKFRFVPLQAMKLCVEVGLYFHALMVFLLASMALTLQRGVTGTARMLHALTHSSISRQVREQM